jgi:hypothetical protein
MRLSLETVSLLSSLGDKSATAANTQMRKAAVSYMIKPMAITVRWEEEDIFIVQTQWE